MIISAIIEIDLQRTQDKEQSKLKKASNRNGPKQAYRDSLNRKRSIKEFRY